jgi:hypothetical protein
MTSSLVEAATIVRRDIDKLGAGMVIVDSAGFAGNGPPEESGTALVLFRAVRTLETPTLVIHHKRKKVAGSTSNGDKDDVFGSAYHTNSVRRLWIARAVPSGENPDIKFVSLDNQKANNGRRQRPRALKLVFDNNDADQLMAVTLTNVDAASTPELASKVPMRERLVASLRNGAMTAHELANELETDLGTIQPMLSRLKKSGKLIQLAENRWGLLQKEESDVHESYR